MWSPHQQALLFVNKKKQKNFNFLWDEAALCQQPPTWQKFFGSFFQKRTACLTTANASPDTSRPTATAALIMRRV